MRKPRGAVALYAAPAVLCACGAVEQRLLADDASPRVVVLRPNTTDELTTEAMARVMGELKAAGFDVVIVPVNSDEGKRDLETVGAELHPIAAFAIFVKPSREGMPVFEIWVSDRIRKKRIIHAAPLDETDRGRGSEVPASRAVELLKARLA